jgi:hypothetical protein
MKNGVRDGSSPDEIDIIINIYTIAGSNERILFVYAVNLSMLNLDIV